VKNTEKKNVATDICLLPAGRSSFGWSW